jgi:Holliday junction DNA helicase RuvA
MIRQVHGTVLSKDLLGVVVDLSGWGVYLHMAEPEQIVVGSDVTLLTHLAINQNGMELFAFPEEADLTFFTQLLGVPGVGPKTALSILRKAPRESLIGAIGKRDLEYLTRVAGLGKKAAEKILVELSEKIGGSRAHDDGDTEVFETLVALGYTDKEARTAVAKIPKEIAGKESRLKSALSHTNN